MAIENAQRVISFRDTKANVEALTGTVKEITFAYAIDSEELGIYDPVTTTWKWISASGQYRQFVYVVSGGDFSFVIDADGKPVMALQELE
jgi:hypothetical protein